jgi:hypothetical protein
VRVRIWTAGEAPPRTFKTLPQVFWAWQDKEKDEGMTKKKIKTKIKEGRTKTKAKLFPREEIKGSLFARIILKRRAK